MANETLLTPALKKAIGTEQVKSTATNQIASRMVQDFILAVEDPNAHYPKAVEYGEYVSPCLLWTQGISYNEKGTANLPDLPEERLDVGGEWEVFKPVKIGDFITAKTKLLDVVERQSKSRGTNMLIVSVFTTYTNQANEIVSTYRHDIMCRKP